MYVLCIRFTSAILTCVEFTSLHIKIRETNIDIIPIQIYLGISITYTICNKHIFTINIIEEFQLCATHVHVLGEQN